MHMHMHMHTHTNMNMHMGMTCVRARMHIPDGAARLRIERVEDGIHFESRPLALCSRVVAAYVATRWQAMYHSLCAGQLAMMRAFIWIA